MTFTVHAQCPSLKEKVVYNTSCTFLIKQVKLQLNHIVQQGVHNFTEL